MTLAILFTVEAAHKLIAFGSYYFNDNWNRFDFAIVALTLIGILIEFLFPNVSIGAQASLIRSFRVLRIFRLI